MVKESPAFEQLFAAAMVNSVFASKLLDLKTRSSALDQYQLTSDERRVLLGLRAESLDEFAENARKALGLDEDAYQILQRT